MARELIVKIKCDMCGKSVNESEVQAGELTLAGKTYGIDLCAEDAGNFTGKLTPKAKALTIESKNKYPLDHPKGEKKMPCPACGHFVKNELGLKFHIKKMHPGSEYS